MARSGNLLQPGRITLFIWAVLTVIVAMAATVPSASAGPLPTVPEQSLRRALHCDHQLSGARHKPVLLLPGTGSQGSYLYPTGFQVDLSAERVPSCYLDPPFDTTGDMQVSATYVVFAIRRMAKQADRRVVVYGFSQGGVLARLALTFWPDTRELVSDVVSASAPQHGSTASVNCASFGCSAASWQRLTDSRLLATLNEGDETPGPTDWTTLRTLDDLNAQPVDGPEPTSVLDGARNFVIQGLCPGREVSHLGMAFDAMAYAALRDASTHEGPVSRRRLLAGDPCARLFAGDLTVEDRQQQISDLNALIIKNNVTAPKVAAEPPVVLHR